MAEVATHLPDRRRTALGLVLDSAFGGIFWGKFFSGTGVWIHAVVGAIVVFAATGSALAVGLVSVAQFAPQLLLTPWSGTWADRGHAWGQMVSGRLMCALGSGSLAVWALLVDARDGWAAVWPVLAASIVVGLGLVLGGPAQQSVIPLLVRPDELRTAMTLNATPMTFARITGPAIGAFVASRFGAGEAFAIAASGHAVFGVVLLTIRIPDGEPRRMDTDYSVRAALQYVRSHRPLFRLLLAVAAVGVGSEPTITLAPALARDLGGDAGLVGALTSAFGVGAAVGLVLVTFVGRCCSQPFVASCGLGLMAAGMAVSAAIVWVPLAMTGFALAGLGFTWAMASLGTLVQLQAPPVLRGRIMALWMVGFVGARPVAAFALGAVADGSTVHVAVAVMAALLAGATVVCRPSKLA